MLTALAALSLGAPTAARAPRRIRTLWWRGTAHLEVGGRALDIATDTRLDVPLLQVRSTTYILEQGPATTRTLVLTPDLPGAWLERAGQRSPLPAQVGIHERQQYAMYAWLLLVQQGKRPRPGKLPLSALPYPDIMFEIGPDGYPLAAEWTVDDAETADAPRIPQRVVFSGRIDSDGVRWPTRFAMTQRGKPYFDLTIAEFSAS